jgi:hypothetical protein
MMYGLIILGGLGFCSFGLHFIGVKVPWLRRLSLDGHTLQAHAAYRLHNAGLTLANLSMMLVGVLSVTGSPNIWFALMEMTSALVAIGCLFAVHAAGIRKSQTSR